MHTKECWLCASAVLCLAATAGAVNIDMVTVGNPGNPGELSGYGAGGYGTNRICGAVDYTFQMGKFEVTATQYAEFLNAVARSDPYGLWSPSMGAFAGGLECNIQRSGSAGNYTYNVPAGSEKRPVNHVSWGDAARFANWLTNGKPTGPQSLSTTEDGSYYLNGATTREQLLAVGRKSDALYVIPSEDEWYKAAYHKNNGPTGDYWIYPTSSDVQPGIALPDITGNNANYLYSGIPKPQPVGSYINSPSPYGTFDQAGNMAEWNESILYESLRGLRGGPFNAEYPQLRAAYRGMNYPDVEWQGIGFRIALVPEPGTLWLLAATGLLVAVRRRTSRPQHRPRSSRRPA